MVDTQIKVDDYEWRWVEKYLDSSLNWEADSNGAKIFYTNENGVITVGDISGETTQSLKAVEVQIHIMDIQ